MDSSRNPVTCADGYAGIRQGTSPSHGHAQPGNTEAGDKPQHSAQYRANSPAPIDLEGHMHNIDGLCRDRGATNCRDARARAHPHDRVVRRKVILPRTWSGELAQSGSRRERDAESSATLE